MNGLRDLGIEVWFNLGDRDLAIALRRAHALDHGARLTEAHTAITAALGVKARVLPMSDQPVRTRVLAHGRWWPFQEFMIRASGRGPIDDVELRGASSASSTVEVLQAVEKASAIVIGPSNPVISIGPILETPGIREALSRSTAAVVAISPLVRGAVVKGPTDVFMEWSGRPLSSDGIAAAYAGLIDGLVADSRADALPTLETDVLMDSSNARRRLAEEALRFAIGLG
jgi:LPPG:FO 2-phospho-L-lactate transferase